jgi:hypothetical protein
MRYRLRTLLLMMAIWPQILAVVWFAGVAAYQQFEEQRWAEQHMVWARVSGGPQSIFAPMTSDLIDLNEVPSTDNRP